VPLVRHPPNAIGIPRNLEYAHGMTYDSSDEEQLEELESRIEELESGGGSRRGDASISIVYALGMSIAIVLSWTRNASILWCILHGFFSWGYVIYFACTR
jgi:hypothetical protein